MILKENCYVGTNSNAINDEVQLRVKKDIFTDLLMDINNLKT